jgi:hypothetical protein
MIFLITSVIYVLLLCKIIFALPKNENIKNFLFLITGIFTFIFFATTIIFSMQIKQAKLLKEEIEYMSKEIGEEFLIYSKAELYDLEHNAFSGLLIRKFFTNEENDVE